MNACRSVAPLAFMIQGQVFRIGTDWISKAFKGYAIFRKRKNSAASAATPLLQPIR